MIREIGDDELMNLLLNYAEHDRKGDILFEDIIIKELREKEQVGIDVTNINENSLSNVFRLLNDETLFCTNKNYLKDSNAKFKLYDDRADIVLNVNNSSDYTLFNVSNPFENLVRNSNGEIDIDKFTEDEKVKMFKTVILYIRKAIKRILFIDNYDSVDFDVIKE